jgi:flagellar biosynthesis chaperone FliJ
MFAMGMSEGEVEEKLAEEISATVELESGRAPAKRTAPNVQALVQSLAEDREDRARVLTELQNVLQEQQDQLTRLTELVEDLKRSWWERLIGHKGKTDRLRGQTDDLGPGKNRWTGSKQ